MCDSCARLFLLLALSSRRLGSTLLPSSLVPVAKKSLTLFSLMLNGPMQSHLNLLSGISTHSVDMKGLVRSKDC